MMVMNMDTIEAGGSGEGATVNVDPGSQPGGALQSLAIFLSVYCGLS